MKIVSKVAKVDQSKCVGCRRCERRCPSEAIKVRGANGEVFTAPCTKACPAGIDVQGYVALAGAGKYEEAYRLIRRNNPFPSVCGRICTHPCQESCNRCGYDESVAIRDIKRFVADQAYKDGKFIKEMVWPKNGKRVAIIGAGPSGLTCAYYLALSGYEVDVFESEKKAGGVLLFGIPEYRLPKEILARDIQAIEDAGVNIHLNTAIGVDVDFKELHEKYDAVYIATGTQFSKHANIPGEDLSGVYHGLDFLKQLSLNEKPEIGKKVVVIGGGNTAIDVSRTAVRMGAESVSILYRRRRSDMPADVREVIEALEEGVQIVEMAAPVALTGDGKVEKIRCACMELGELDSKGRRMTKPVEGKEFEIEADTVIVAVSQYSDFPFIDKSEVEITEFGKLVLDEQRMTTLPGVFAGGDVMRGSATAIQAIADGKQAAININAYLGLASGINSGAEIDLPPKKEFDWNNDRTAIMENLPAAERVKNFDEVALGLTEEQVKMESSRCYRCSGKASVEEEFCVDCNMCWEYCDSGAITMEPLPEDKVISYPLPGPELTEKVIEICRKIHLAPTFDDLCVCTTTTTEEVINAIITGGARTLKDITRLCGIRGGCTAYCTNYLFMILEACGYPTTAPANDAYHEVKLTRFNFPTDLKLKDLQEDIDALPENQRLEEARLEQQFEEYRKLVIERSKKNG